MTKESVLTILERNPNYHDFKNEFKGGFCLLYHVFGAQIVVFNEVGKQVSLFILSTDQDLQIEKVQEFCYWAYIILNDINRFQQ